VSHCGYRGPIHAKRKARLSTRRGPKRRWLTQNPRVKGAVVGIARAQASGRGSSVSAASASASARSAKVLSAAGCGDRPHRATSGIHIGHQRQCAQIRPRAEDQIFLPYYRLSRLVDQSFLDRGKACQVTAVLSSSALRHCLKHSLNAVTARAPSCGIGNGLTQFSVMPIPKAGGAPFGAGRRSLWAVIGQNLHSMFVSKHVVYGPRSSESLCSRLVVPDRWVTKPAGDTRAPLS